MNMEDYRSRRETHIDETEGRVEIDALAREGFLKKGDIPGTDLFDEGMDEFGNVSAPGSTTVSSGGTYMEEAGPNDQVRRDRTDELRATMEGLEVVEDPDEEAKASGAHADMYEGNDAAAQWLRTNDPNYKKRTAVRKKAR